MNRAKWSPATIGQGCVAGRAGWRIRGLVSEQWSGPEDQMSPFLGLGQGLGLGTQLQERGKVQAWSKGQNVEYKQLLVNPK